MYGKLMTWIGPRVVISSKWRRFCTSRPPDQKSRFFAPGETTWLVSQWNPHKPSLGLRSPNVGRNDFNIAQLLRKRPRLKMKKRTRASLSKPALRGWTCRGRRNAKHVWTETKPYCFFYIFHSLSIRRVNLFGRMRSPFSSIQVAALLRKETLYVASRTYQQRGFWQLLHCPRPNVNTDGV